MKSAVDTLEIGMFFYLFIYLARIKRNIRMTDGERGDKINAIVNGYTFYIVIFTFNHCL